MGLLEANTGSGWFDLPTPSPENYSPTYTHEEKSYLNASGYLVRDIVRYNRAKVTCGWNTLDDIQMAILQSLYSLKSFQLKFTDNFGNRVIKKVYAGPVDGKTKLIDKNTYKLTLRTGVQANFIEY